ncbi:MAG TPA: hypothetical protein DCQ98_21930 [Planctomycetaceae bacterium]|nr:hypothetical protein [Planctomycetaceae bacterium]HRE98940.1 sialate O-acetylesterase [Pirellulaceae bacterium]
MKRLLHSLFGLLALASTASGVEGPLKVFILAGQSNMQGHADVSTLDYLADDPSTAGLLNDIRAEDGSFRVIERVRITSVGCAGDGWSDVIEQVGPLTAGFGASTEKIGPELTFGITMARSIDGPILIIKTAWGGRSLMTDFRPPSAGPRVFSQFIRDQWRERGLDPDAEAERHERELNGVFYRHMIEHVKQVLGDLPRVVPDYDPARGYELAGFVWFQGFNDLVDGWSYPDGDKPDGYREYADLLGHLIRDVRRDLDAPQLPVVIGVMGIGGADDEIDASQRNFRAAQASVAELPEFRDNVIAVPTAPFWSDELGAIDRKHEQVGQQRWYLESKHPEHANADGKMSAEEIDASVRKYEQELISPAEAALWKRGASNGGYHYLGCARTLAAVGRAFAQANLELMKKAETR